MGIFKSNKLIAVLIILLITTVILFFIGPELIQSRYYYMYDETNGSTAVGNRGSVGDAFGGTLGPIIAWVAAVLTFAAFYIQYEANKVQRDQFEKQSSDTAKQRFENIFFEMLKLHKENINEMSIEGYDVSEVFVKESSGPAHNINTKTSKSTQEIKKIINGRKVFVTSYNELKACYEICNHTLKFETIENKERYLISLAYKFFYSGIGSLAVIMNDAKILNDKVYVKKCKEELYKARRQHESSFGAKNKYRIPGSNIDVELFFKYKPFAGHSSRFGHYYRHLFYMVSYVVNQEEKFIDYDEKRNYLKILRAQLSDQEQGMLYLNYLAGFGSNWETKTNKFFSDFRMIHNMPLHLADFTIKPVDEFKEQIEKIRKTGEEMFEHFE